MIEKPFGHDLESARALNRTLLDAFPEESVYRIDHFLGKEPVENLSYFRFANGIFEPLWHRHFVDNVHLLQTVATLAMDPPAHGES